MIDNIFLQYFNDIKKYPLLTIKQEIELADLVQSGSKAAMDSLVNSNLRLVVLIAKKYTANTTLQMELIQEGNIGLIKAAQRFSKNFNVRFSSYASFWIKQSINRYLNSCHKKIKLPIRKEAALKIIETEKENYYISNGVYPSSKELANILGLSEKDVLELEYLKDINIYSLDAPVNEATPTMYDTVPCNSYNPEDIVLKDMFKNDVDKCLDLLSAKEKNVLRKRYCLDGRKKPASLRKLGKLYFVSPEAVRQIQIRALKKLQKNSSYIKKSVFI